MGQRFSLSVRHDPSKYLVVAVGVCHRDDIITVDGHCVFVALARIQGFGIIDVVDLECERRVA